jgi:acetyl-CoA synthetase
MQTLHKKYVNEVLDEMGRVQSFSYNVPDNFVFAYDVVDELAKTKPNAVAMLWRNDKGKAHTFTFADMKKYSDNAAAAFQKGGITKGDIVMLVLKRHYHFWFAILGLNKIGAVTVPATNQLQLKDLVYRFNAADIKAVLCTHEGEICDFIDEAQAECPSLKLKFISGGKKDGWLSFESELKNDGKFDRPHQENNDTMLLYFTSGTSGMPKMVAHDNTYAIAHIATAKYWHNVQEGKPHLTVSETGWGKAVWGKLYGQWFMESVIYVYDMERFNAHNLLTRMQNDKICTFCAPPTIYRMLIQENLNSYDLSSITYATVAGEALNPEVFNKFKEATGLSLMEGFGQTETTLTVANLLGTKPKPGSMGKPVCTYAVTLLDANGNRVRPGVVGEICIGTKNGKPVGMFKGYHKDPNLTASVWHDDFYHTGDMAWEDEDGYLWYMSRKDDVIKSSGYRIGPFEVESVLMEHPAVMECAVTGVPDPVRGMAVKATIVLTKNYKPSDELKKDIQNYVKTHTAPYKYPRVIEFASELPKTISGKIRRTEIRQGDGVK